MKCCMLLKLVVLSTFLHSRKDLSLRCCICLSTLILCTTMLCSIRREMRLLRGDMELTSFFDWLMIEAHLFYLILWWIMIIGWVMNLLLTVFFEISRILSNLITVCQHLVFHLLDGFLVLLMSLTYWIFFKGSFPCSSHQENHQCFFDLLLSSQFFIHFSLALEFIFNFQSLQMKLSFWHQPFLDNFRIFKWDQMIFSLLFIALDEQYYDFQFYFLHLPLISHLMVLQSIFLQFLSFQSFPND